MPATFSMKTFMDKVKSGNRFFNLQKSSLNGYDYANTGQKSWSLIGTLGGAYDSSRGDDLRTLNREALISVQGIIWPEGVGSTDAKTPWFAKKETYRLALGYLANQLFGLDSADALLVGSYKDNYAHRTLAADMRFVSKKGINVNELHKSGALSASYATEVCIPTGGIIGDWARHKFVFGAPMIVREGKLAKSGLKNFGFGKYTYCFTRKAGTDYYCTQALTEGFTATTEVAFPDDIPLSYIRVYDQAGSAAPTQPWECPDF